MYLLGDNHCEDYFKASIRNLCYTNGKRPFVEWLENLKNKTDRYRIKERLDRITLGNFGDHKNVANGVYELRLTFGPGYRIYYGIENKNIIILLCGGDKSSQKKDIKNATKYLNDYLSR